MVLKQAGTYAGGPDSRLRAMLGIIMYIHQGGCVNCGETTFTLDGLGVPIPQDRIAVKSENIETEVLLAVCHNCYDFEIETLDLDHIFAGFLASELDFAKTDKKKDVVNKLYKHLKFTAARKCDKL